jgi:YidC/Oxa1 family membrane protein insertase
MGMDFRRLILVFIFSLSIMMLWGEWQKEANKLNKPAATATVPAQPAAPGSVPVPSANAPTPTAVPGAPGAPVATAAPANTSQKLRIKTDVLVADLDSQGGDLRYLEFLKHKDTLDKTKNFILLEYQGTHTYIAQTGLVAANAQLPTHQSQFAFVAGPTELKDGQTTLAVRLEATTPSAKVTKVYTFTRGSYVVDVAYEVTNLSGQPIAPQAYTQLVRDNKAPKGDSTFLQTYTGMAMFTEANKYQKQDFKDIEKKKEIPTKTADNGWIGIIQHYFATAWIPEGKAPREFYTRAEANNLFSAGMLTQVGTIAPNATGTFKAKLYAGPTDQDVMKTIAPGLDLTVDYGWLTILAQPMFWLLKFLHGMTNNWGWAIVLLTVVIKAAFFPLSAASYKSMARMKKVTPRLMEIRERYGSDRMKMNQAMMELYKTEKINPLGGCLPIVIQIPVFIALYWVLLASVEIRHQPWVLWIQDLTATDPYYVLPVIMAVSMFIQTKMNPTPPDPIQAKVMMFMPIVFSVFFFFFPAGLVLYWVVNNILSIAQQWQITRMIERGEDKEKAKA